MNKAYLAMRYAFPAMVICFLLATLGIFVGRAIAGPNQLVGTTVSINGTQNTAASSFGTFLCFPSSSFVITNSGMADTNALTVNAQFSIDNTNWLTIASYTPVLTNATNETWKPSITPQAGYWRVQIVTTGALDIGIVGNY